VDHQALEAMVPLVRRCLEVIPQIVTTVLLIMTLTCHPLAARAQVWVPPALILVSPRGLQAIPLELANPPDPPVVTPVLALPLTACLPPPHPPLVTCLGAPVIQYQVQEPAPPTLWEDPLW